MFSGIFPLIKIYCNKSGKFDKFFIIRPSITFSTFSNDNYSTTAVGEKGKPVAAGFEYNSLNNPHYLSVEEIREFLEKVK